MVQANVDKQVSADSRNGCHPQDLCTAWMSHWGCNAVRSDLATPSAPIKGTTRNKIYLIPNGHLGDRHPELLQQRNNRIRGNIILQRTMPRMVAFFRSIHRGNYGNAKGGPGQIL